jgi:hypothetical protein
MRIRPHQRQHIADILRDELEQANLRISERLAQFEDSPAANKGEDHDEIRRFYEDLADKSWTEADQECLDALGDLAPTEIKQTLREAFRRSSVHPVPSFAALINVLKKNELEPGEASEVSRPDSDALGAQERERLANVLHAALTDAASEIASVLKLGDGKAGIVREQLEIVEGRIISDFTPLV